VQERTRGTPLGCFNDIKGSAIAEKKNERYGEGTSKVSNEPPCRHFTVKLRNSAERPPYYVCDLEEHRNKPIIRNAVHGNPGPGLLIIRSCVEPRKHVHFVSQSSETRRMVQAVGSDTAGTLRWKTWGDDRNPHE